MNNTLRALAARRASLCTTIEMQREDLAAQFARWHGPLKAVDQGLGVLHYLQRKPLWIVGGVLLLAAGSPTHLRRRWIQAGLVAWQLLGAWRHR